MYGHMMYYGGGYGYYPGFDIFHILFGALAIAFIVWVVFMIVRGGRGKRWRRWHWNDALSILDERFAKGEVDKDEYEERRKALLGEK